jgi:hypothetical protein
MHKSVLYLAIIGVVAGCQSVPQQQYAQFPSAPPPQAGTPITLTAAEIKQVQAGVQASLKDPASAIFSGATLAAKEANGDITACGLVNAKNSYGGYVGASPYIATMRNGIVVDSATGSGRDDVNILLGMCRAKGVPV